MQKGALPTKKGPETNEKKGHGLQLNLGAKDGKDMLDLSSDSDSDGDYEEVNEIVQSFINKQQKKANASKQDGGG